jgi:hypothetical protein
MRNRHCRRNFLAGSLLLATGLLLGTTAPASAQRKGKSVSQELTAGPIRCRFVDGELRYLYVGEKEIVRRVYFAVRDRHWDTIVPEFKRIRIKQRNDTFTVELDAVVKGSNYAGEEPVDFGWKGTITGTADGVITFEATGTANADFLSNRIGLCVLYGSPSVVGTAFETLDKNSTLNKGTFPEFVQPQLVAPKYQTLTYRTADGVKVATSVVGATFDMEDQRTYGDSSFKAYAPLPYTYPNATKSAGSLTQSVTIRVENTPKPAKVSGPLTVTVGKSTVPNAKIPVLRTEVPATVKDTIFGNINGQRDQYRTAEEVAWGYKPSVHLFDDDTFFENNMSLVDHARTVRSFAPNATLKVMPIHLEPSHPRAAMDPRRTALFGGAWAANLIHYLSIAGVSEAGFTTGPGYASRVVKTLGSYVGRGLIACSVSGSESLPASVDAFTIDDGGSPVVTLINTANAEQRVTVKGLPTRNLRLRRMNGKTAADALPTEETKRGEKDGINISLAPYEVCLISGG